MLLLINELKEGMKLKNTVYKDNSILAEKGMILDIHTIDKLKSFGVINVEIEDEDIEHADMEDVIMQENILKEAIGNDFEEAMKKTQTIMENIKDGKINEKAINEVVENTLSNILTDSDISLGLLEGKGGHDYLYKHAINTVVISTIIGNALGYDKKQLDTLAKGALLHDVGMLQVDESILRKEKDLSPEDIKEIEKHTIHGYEALKNLGEDIAQIAKYHHEKLDGSGYPEGLTGDQIPEMAKIVAVADVYTALTEDRKYRNKYENYDAMKIVMQSSATKLLDHNILKIFLKYMPIYPINSYVILNNNKKAKVVKANKNPFRPVVDIEEEGKIIRLDLMSEINATKYIIGVAK
jgi:HD-GYP domain-containing protein (c-di-GMP phosphodiesterase class II)